MPRKRMIDPAIWESEQVMSLSPAQFKLYIYLIGHSDDEGRLKICYPMIAARAFPLDGVSEETVETDIKLMHAIGLVQVYADDDSTYLCHPNWSRYQSINKPRLSTLPVPGENGRATVVIREDDGSDTEGLPPNRIEKKRKEENSGRSPDTAPLPYSGWGEDSVELWLYHCFEERYQSIMPDLERQTKAVGQLVLMAEARGDASVILQEMLNAFDRLKADDSTPKGFWRKQPALPAQMVSLWAQLYEESKEMTKAKDQGALPVYKEPDEMGQLRKEKEERLKREAEEAGDESA